MTGPITNKISYLILNKKEAEDLVWIGQMVDHHTSIKKGHTSESSSFKMPISLTKSTKEW